MKKITLDPVAKAGIAAGGAAALYFAYTKKMNFGNAAGVVIGGCLIGFFATSLLSYMTNKSNLPGATATDTVADNSNA
jgi:hypothetical protein